MFKKPILAVVILLALAISTQIVFAATAKKLTVKEKGSLALTTSGITPKTLVYVGGGVWDYGSEIVNPTTKKIHSNYNHLTLYHKSASKIGANYAPPYYSESVITAPGTYSTSSVTGPIAWSGNAYWWNYN